MNGLFKKDFSSLNRRRKQKPSIANEGFKLHNSLDQEDNIKRNVIIPQDVKNNTLGRTRNQSYDILMQKIENITSGHQAKYQDSSPSKHLRNHLERRQKDDSNTPVTTIVDSSKLIFSRSTANTTSKRKLLEQDPVVFLMLKSLEVNGTRKVGEARRLLTLNILPEDEYLYFTIGDQIIEKLVLNRQQNIANIYLSDLGRLLLIVLSNNKGYIYVNYLSLDMELINRFQDKADIWPVNVRRRFRNKELLFKVDEIKKMLEQSKLKLTSPDQLISTPVKEKTATTTSTSSTDPFALLETPFRTPRLINSKPTTYTIDPLQGPSSETKSKTKYAFTRLQTNREVASSPIPSSNSDDITLAPKVEHISLQSPVRSRTRSNVNPDVFLVEKPDPFDPPLTYKFKDNKKFIVTHSDFKTLFNNDWINDTIIDFFIKYDLEQAIIEGKFTEKQIYAFNSFFFSKLMSQGSNNANGVDNYYSNVKKWLQKIDLMTFPYLIIPINEHSHWYCCMIRGLPEVLTYTLSNPQMEEESTTETPKSETSPNCEVLSNVSENYSKTQSPVAETSDSKTLDLPIKETAKEEKEGLNNLLPNTNNTDDLQQHENDSTSSILPKPLKENNDTKPPPIPKAEIFIFDSLSLKHSSIHQPLRQLFIEYCSDKYGINMTKEQFKFINARVPKQNNFNDCGIHVIYNVRKWLSDHVECERLWKAIPSLSTKFQSRQFFKASERNSTRKVLRDTLLKLQKSTENEVDKLTSNSDTDDIEIIEMVSKERKLPIATRKKHEEVEVSPASDLEYLKKTIDDDPSADYSKNTKPPIINKALRKELSRKQISNLAIQITNQIFPVDEDISKEFATKVIEFIFKIDSYGEKKNQISEELDKFIPIVVAQRKSGEHLKTNTEISSKIEEERNQKGKSVSILDVRPKDEKLVIQHIQADDSLNSSIADMEISDNEGSNNIESYNTFPNKRRKAKK